MKEFFNYRITHIFLVLAIGLIAYANSMNGPFVIDDTRNIVENPLVRDLNYFINLSEAKTVCHNADSHITLYTAFKSRYIGYLSFALNYFLHGLEVKGYHIINIIVHLSNALLVYFLVLLTFSTPFLVSLSHRYSADAALFTALIFVAHPLQTQAVTYIVQRFASLTTVFYLLSIVFYVRWRLGKAGIKEFGKERGRVVKRPFSYLLSLLCVIAAMKTKEIAFTLPLIIMLYEFVFFELDFKKNFVWLIPYLLTLLVIPLTLFVIDPPAGSAETKMRVATDISRADYLMTEFRVIVTYIRLLFLPVNQRFWYYYPIYNNFFDPNVFFSFLFIIFAAGASFFLFLRYRFSHPYLRAIFFGIFFFFIALSVESGIVPIADVIFEHRVYLPSSGFFIAFTVVVFSIGRRKEVVVCLSSIILILTLLTIQRNKVWSSEISLWEYEVSLNPYDGKLHNDLGNAYLREGRVDEAIKELKEAIRLDPEHVDAYYNLGSLYASQGMAKEAFREFGFAIEIKPDHFKSHQNLGVLLMRSGRLEEAATEFRLALAFKDNNPEPFKKSPNIALIHYNLGVVLKKLNRFDEAVREFQTALSIHPDHAKSHYSLGTAYALLQRYDEAIFEIEEALRLAPENEAFRQELQRLTHLLRK